MEKDNFTPTGLENSPETTQAARILLASLGELPEYLDILVREHKKAETAKEAWTAYADEEYRRENGLI